MEYTTYDRGAKKYCPPEKEHRKNRWIRDIYFDIRRIHTNYLFADFNGKSKQTIFLITACIVFLLVGVAGIHLSVTEFIAGIPSGTFWWHVVVLVVAVAVTILFVYLVIRIAPLWCARGCLILNEKRLRFVGIRKKAITRISIPRSEIASFVIEMEKNDDLCIYTIYLCIPKAEQYPKFTLQCTQQYKLWEEYLLKLASNFDIPIEIDGAIPKDQRKKWAKTKEKLDALGKSPVQK